MILRAGAESQKAFALLALFLLNQRHGIGLDFANLQSLELVADIVILAVDGGVSALSDFGNAGQVKGPGEIVGIRLPYQLDRAVSRIERIAEQRLLQPRAEFADTFGTNGVGYGGVDEVERDIELSGLVNRPRHVEALDRDLQGFETREEFEKAAVTPGHSQPILIGISGERFRADQLDRTLRGKVLHAREKIGNAYAAVFGRAIAGLLATFNLQQLRHRLQALRCILARHHIGSIGEILRGGPEQHEGGQQQRFEERIHFPPPASPATWNNVSCDISISGAPSPGSCVPPWV